MGASNFGRLQGCSNLWTFGLDDYDRDEIAYMMTENNGENVPTEREVEEAIAESKSQDCDDTIENVVCELKTKDFYGETLKEYYEDYKIIGYFNVEYYNRVGKYWDNNEYYIIVEYGYYEGGRFDIVHHEDGYFSEIYINKSYNKKLAKTIKECEKVFSMYTTPMVRVGGFSDGTSLYESIK